MPKVSVVIPSYNRAEKVVPAVESILDQQYRDFDVWVVDDGSTDDTRGALRPLLGDQVRYVYQGNGGASKARNTGIAASHGEYVAFLDSDDTASPDRLKAQVAFLDAHPGASAVFCDVWKVQTEGTRRRFAEQVPGFLPRIAPYDADGQYLIPAEVMLAQALVGPPMKPSTLMVRRSCLNKMGLFDVTVIPSEALDFLLRLARYGAPIGYIHRPLVNLLVWEGGVHVRQFQRAVGSAIGILLRFRKTNELSPEGGRRVREAIALQHYWLGKHLQDARAFRRATSAFLRGFAWSHNPIFLGHAFAVWLPSPVFGAARRLRRLALANIFIDPWQSGAEVSSRQQTLTGTKSAMIADLSRRIRGGVKHRLRETALGALWSISPGRTWLDRARRHRWVFVAGCNRSGKTSLANLVRNHPSVAVIGNANSHTQALPNSESEGCPHIWTEKLDRFRLVEGDDPTPAARLIFDWLHHVKRERPVIVIESDLPAIQMRWLQEVLPDTHFIGVVRNGYAVAEGLRLKEGYAIDRCARQWNVANSVMLHDAGRIRHFMLVRYEAFAAHPMTVAEELASFIGLDSAPLRPFVLNGWRLANTDRRPSILRDANPDLLNRLTQEEIDTITANARQMLEELGYPAPTRDLPSHERA